VIVIVYKWFRNVATGLIIQPCGQGVVETHILNGQTWDRICSAAVTGR